MKQIWKKWCKKVERHNRYIDYGNYEDAWSPCTIFSPFLLGLFVIFAFWIMTQAPLAVAFVTYLIVVFVFSVFYYVNWCIIEKENDRIDAAKVNKAYCDECKYSFQQFEYCQELKDGRIVCEKCFFDMAMKTLNSKEKKIDFNYNVVDVNCEDTEGLINYGNEK